MTVAARRLLPLSLLSYWRTLLALASRAGPPRVNATLIGSAFLSLFVANTLIGIIGSWYDRVTPAEFWLLNEGIAATGGVLTMLLHRPLTALLAQEGSYVSGRRARHRPLTEPLTVS